MEIKTPKPIKKKLGVRIHNKKACLWSETWKWQGNAQRKGNGNGVSGKWPHQYAKCASGTRGLFCPPFASNCSSFSCIHNHLYLFYLSTFAFIRNTTQSTIVASLCANSSDELLILCLFIIIFGYVLQTHPPTVTATSSETTWMCHLWN